MLLSWLDRWDEKRAQRGEATKAITQFELGAALAFPDAPEISSLSQFCLRAVDEASRSSFYEEPDKLSTGFERSGSWLTFPSDLSTDVNNNNIVSVKITVADSSRHALIVFHHWNASGRNSRLAQFFAKRGITVAEIALPYHFERSRPGSEHADYMLSANVGRNLQSMRQAVLDGRKLIRWLNEQGYPQISVLGMSLGSWVAGLVAAHDTAVSKASLFLTAGPLADMVWTGRATRSIRKSLSPEMNLSDLRTAWAPVDMGRFAKRFVRPTLDLQIVLAKRDTVVIPELSRQFITKLEGAGVAPRVLELNCGHYSLGAPPFILLAGLSLHKFLTTKAGSET